MLCLSLDLVTLHFICAPGPDDAFCFRYYPVSATTAKRIYDETINSDYDYNYDYDDYDDNEVDSPQKDIANIKPPAPTDQKQSIPR